MVAGKGGSIFDDRSKPVEENKTAPEGIVLYDADLSVDKTVSILYAGEVWKEAVNGGTVDDAIKQRCHSLNLLQEKEAMLNGSYL